MAITRTLKANRDAKEELMMKFQEQEWISLCADCDEKGLVYITLDRIEKDACAFNELVTMLRDIEGMGQVVELLSN